MKKIKEIWKEIWKSKIWKSKTFKTILFLIFQLSLVVTGITLLWIYGCWQLALGVFLLIWGNNYTIRDNMKKEIANVFINILNKDDNEEN